MRCFAVLFLIFASVVALQQEEESTTTRPGSLFSRNVAAKPTGADNKCSGVTTTTGNAILDIFTSLGGSGCPGDNPVCVSQSFGQVFTGKATFKAPPTQGDKCVVCYKSSVGIGSFAIGTHFGCPTGQVCKNWMGREVSGGQYGRKCEKAA